MKVLLYEPGDHGHRPIILRYTQKALEQSSISWVHEDRDLSKNPHEVLHKAVSCECDFIYVLTLERLAKFAWILSWIASRKEISVVCTYYKYNNLVEGWRAYVWRLVLWTSRIKTIFISDDSLKSNDRVYPPKVKFLPDPWDPDEFQFHSKELAQKRLSLNGKPVVFLMFGSIDERKGANTLLTAISILNKETNWDNLVFVFAGVATESIKETINKIKDNLRPNIQLVFHNHYIDEGAVSSYFYGADFIINAYPSWFKVSSGSVTRAFAAGRPVIVPHVGVNAEVASLNNCGIIFEAENPDSLKTALDHAISIRKSLSPSYITMCESALAIGRERSLAQYRFALAKGLK